MLDEEKCFEMLEQIKATCSHCRFEKGDRRLCEETYCLLHGMRNFPMQQKLVQEQLIDKLLKRMKKEN